MLVFPSMQSGEDEARREKDRERKFSRAENKFFSSFLLSFVKLRPRESYPFKNRIWAKLIVCFFKNIS